MENKFSLKNARKAKHSVIRRNYQQPETTEQPVVVPGVIPQGKVCPPPFEIDVLRVTKVFDECRIVDTNEITDVPVAPPVGAVDVQCLGAELIAPPICVIDPVTNVLTVTFSFVTAYQFLTAAGTPIGDVQIIETLNETRSAILPRAGEPGLSCLVDIFLECIQCFISATGPAGQILEVTCCVGKQIVFKLVADVQLLVPTFGYVPAPPICEQPPLGECPPFTPIWPPFPPQSPDFPGPIFSTSSCGAKGKAKSKE